MKIFNETKKLVAIEKQYTRKILNNLMIIEKDKLYVELKYSSLYKYLTCELSYSDAESVVRVNAVRLMLKSKAACKKINEGSLSLSNASKANQCLTNHKVKDQKILENVIEKASTQSNRKFKDYLDQTFKQTRREVVVLDERTLEKFDRLRKKYGNEFSSYELIQIMLEKELRAPSPSTESAVTTVPAVKRQERSRTRYIPKATKMAKYTGKCTNCDKQYDLEWDHIHKYSHGGTNGPKNIQQLCRSCNQRKEIRARQTHFFG